MTIDPGMLTASLSLSSALNGTLEGTTSISVSSTPALVVHRLTTSNATQGTPTMTYDPGMLTASLSLSSARKGAIQSRTSILVLSPPALLLHPLPSSTARQATPTLTYDPSLFTASLFFTLNGATRTTISTRILSPPAPVTTCHCYLSMELRKENTSAESCVRVAAITKAGFGVPTSCVKIDLGEFTKP